MHNSEDYNIMVIIFKSLEGGLYEPIKPHPPSPPPGYRPDCVRDMYTIQLQVICTNYTSVLWDDMQELC